MSTQCGSSMGLPCRVRQRDQTIKSIKWVFTYCNRDAREHIIGDFMRHFCDHSISYTVTTTGKKPIRIVYIFLNLI
jgi:hypothetical protein